MKDLKPNSKKKISIVCPWCGSSFERYFFKLQQSGNFLCQKCAIAEKLSKTIDPGTKNNMLTVLGQSERSGRSVCKCECGNLTDIPNKDFISGRVKSCGCLRVASMKKNSVHLKGKKHGMWKGGITSERQSLMTTKKYKDWKKSILKRDNFTCLKCGATNKNLNTHHIANYEDNKSDALSLDNGATLCGGCHRSFHAKYGKRDTDRAQFNEFIGS